MSSRAEQLASFGHLLDIIDTLRVKCPWDAKQTNESLRPNTIEEVFELSQALLQNDIEDIKKELGDVLLHIVFYAKIGAEKAQFDIRDVCDSISEKLIFRHPHVFGTTAVASAEEVEQNWEQIKLKEKGAKKSVMSGVPASLPSMIKACRIQEKAANIGFDWERKEQVWNKVQEELAEVQQELCSPRSEKSTENEIGDLLFSIINAARLYGINPDTALERTNTKFLHRFGYMEKKATENGKSIKDYTLPELDKWWEEAKSSDPK